MIDEILKPSPTTFLVKRTSALDNYTPPCAGAHLANTVRVDRRVGTGPDDFVLGSVAWYARGTNHRVENGCIVRDLGLQARWAVEITDLMQFVATHGRCVIGIENGYNAIEIYDDYRE